MSQDYLLLISTAYMKSCLPSLDELRNEECQNAIFSNVTLLVQMLFSKEKNNGANAFAKNQKIMVRMLFSASSLMPNANATCGP